jgi:hypothetical protein
MAGAEDAGRYASPPMDLANMRKRRAVFARLLSRLLTYGQREC